MASKSSLRETALRKRQALPPAERSKLSLACCEKLCDYIRHVKQTHPLIIGFYAATKTELDVLPALEALAAEHITALPVIPEGRNPLHYLTFRPGDLLQKGMFGIREPAIPTEEVTPNIVIVPLLAFDRSGHRVGYGAGYYDTTLSHLRKIQPTMAIGIAFAFQEGPALPCTSHDQPLDIIITEKEIITPHS